MEVVLRQDVEKVGLRGEVIDVAPGFARNYLIPRNLAERATPALVAELRKREEQRARHEARSFEQAQEIAGRLEERELRFDVQAGPTGTLFGSVTPTDIADELWRQLRTRVDRRKIDLPETIKRIGRYQVPIEIFTDVTATVRVAVVPEGGELPPEEELQAAEAAEAAEAEAAAARAAEAAEAADRAVEELTSAEEEAEAAEAEAEPAAEPPVPDSGPGEGVPGEQEGSPGERAAADTAEPRQP